MRFKKTISPFRPSVRRLLASMLQDAAILANAHPLVIATAPMPEKGNRPGVHPTVIEAR